MKIVNFKNISNEFIRRNYVIDNVSFLSRDECTFIYNSCDKDINILKCWFDKIGIVYNNLFFIGDSVFYTIDNMQFCLSDLSSGERYLLYLMACKKVNKEVVALSLFERLGGALEDVVYNEFKDYNNLTVVVFSFIINPKFKYLYKEEIV